MIGTIANELQQMLPELADKGLEMNKSKTKVMMENNTVRVVYMSTVLRQ